MSASFIARRYFFSKGNRNAVNLLSGLSMLGFACGTAALIVVMSVFNGFELLIGSLYNQFDPPLKIEVVEGKTFDIHNAHIQSMLKDSNIESWGFCLEDQVMAKYGSRQTLVWIKGIDSTFLKQRAWNEVITGGEPILGEGNQSYAIVGDGVSNRLNIDLHSNFLIQLLSPKVGVVDLMSPENAFEQKTLFPSATFGIQQEIDGKYILVPRGFAADLLHKEDQASSLEIFLKPGASETQMQEKIQTFLGKEFNVKDRPHQHEAINKIVNSEKIASFIILTFILLIAGFNIIASLSMLTAEKARDISVLHALGATDRMIKRIFTLDGLYIAIGGTLLGMVGGFLLVWGQYTYGWVGLGDSGSFVVDAYPVKIVWSDFLLVFITGCLLGSLMALIPARRSIQMAKWGQ